VQFERRTEASALGRASSDPTPPPSISVEKRTLRGAEVAVVTVLPADAPPVSYRGRIWVRVGPRRGIATLQDERILNEKRRFRDRTFDAHPVATASLNDLSRTRFEEEYLRGAFAQDVVAANARSYEQRLAAAKMVASPDEPIPTVAGLLVLVSGQAIFYPARTSSFCGLRARSCRIRSETTLRFMDPCRM